MKKLVLCLALLVACGRPLTADDVKTGLTWAQELCVLATGFTDSKAVLEFCKIDAAFTPAVEAILADELALKRAWGLNPDGGAGK